MPPPASTTSDRTSFEESGDAFTIASFALVGELAKRYSRRFLDEDGQATFMFALGLVGAAMVAVSLLAAHEETLVQGGLTFLVLALAQLAGLDSR